MPVFTERDHQDGLARHLRPEVPSVAADDALLTRARAIRLLGVALAGTALAVILPEEADAKARRRNNKRRKNRRRKRQRAVTSNPSRADFGPTPVGSSSPPQNVTITNNGDTAVTLAPRVTGDGYSVDPQFSGVDGFTLQPGASIDVPVVFSPTVLGGSEGLLEIVARDGLVVERVELLGEGLPALPI